MIKWQDKVILAPADEPAGPDGQPMVEMGFHCPKCNMPLTQINDGGSTTCPTCQMTWRRMAGQLFDDEVGE